MNAAADIASRLVVDLAWQATACLALVLAASYLWRPHAARAHMALPVASSRSSLKRRVAHLLRGAIVRPRVGARWTVAASAVALLTVVAFALAQERPAVAIVDVATSESPSEGESSLGSTTKHVRGTIRDALGAPVAGAEVYLVGQKNVWKENLGPMYRFDHRFVSLHETTSDGEGRYEFETAIDLQELMMVSAVARSEGSGLGVACVYNSFRFSSAMPSLDYWLSEVDVRIPPRATIQGRILSPSGNPIQGATVELASMTAPIGDAGELDEWWAVVTAHEYAAKASAPRFWPKPTVTDDQGRFMLDGLGDGATAVLHIDADGYVRHIIEVATDAAQRRLSEQAASSGQTSYRPTQLPPRFDYVLEPPRILEGTVTSQATGDPVAGVEIHVSASTRRLRGASDGQGKYRLLLPTAEYNNIVVRPPAGYVAHERSFTGQVLARRQLAEGAIRHDVRLASAPVLRGRVVDADTGDPIAAAGVWYEPARGNTRVRATHSLEWPVLTDERGEFAISGLLDRGFILVEAPSSEYIRAPLARERVFNDRDALPHGFVEIDVPDAPSMQVGTIALRRGHTLEARIVAPNGDTVTSFRAACAQLSAHGKMAYFDAASFDGGLFRLDGIAAGSTTRVFFYSGAHQAGAVAELALQPDAAEPDVVRLLPCATLRGRLVHRDGNPAIGVHVSPLMLLADEEITDDLLDEFDFQRVEFGVNFTLDHRARGQTRDDGRFELSGFIPNFLLIVYQALASGRMGHPVGRLSPGEVRDLGDIVLAE